MKEADYDSATETVNRNGVWPRVILKDIISHSDERLDGLKRFSVPMPGTSQLPFLSFWGRRGVNFLIFGYVLFMALFEHS